jgi:hypothetical protein
MDSWKVNEETVRTLYLHITVQTKIDFKTKKPTFFTKRFVLKLKTICLNITIWFI